MLNPCARESKARTGRCLREKLMSDDGIFLRRRATRNGERARFVGIFSRMHRALDGWILLARSPASPAQGLHHHEPRYFNFSYFWYDVVVVVFFTLTDRASTIPSNIRGCQSGTWSAGQKKIRGTSTKLQ